MVMIHSILDVINNLPAETSFSLPAFKQNALKIDFSNDHDVQTTYSGAEPILPFAESKVCDARIVQSRLLTTTDGDCKAVYEVTFDVEGSHLTFKAGDTIGVIPHNDESDVSFIISHLGLAATADLSYTLTLDSSVKGAKVPPHVPVKSSLRHVLTDCLDLRSVLKKLFLLALSRYTKDEKEKRILEYLCSKEGSNAYTNYVLNQGLCILDIFNIFSSCKPPIEVLLANLPRLLPRPYSIVNSGLKNNNVVTICFSVMTVNNRKGLITGWLEKLVLNQGPTLETQIQNLSLSNRDANEIEKIPIYLRKNMNMFCLPESLSVPLILIGPGTGVAPFIGFLEERQVLKEQHPEITLGETWLFFGCRNPKLDFIYEEELNSYLDKGVLNKLCTAYSRIDDTTAKYIQDALTQHIEEVIKLINSGAIVYICGDLYTMAAQVKDIIAEGFVQHASMTKEEAISKITEMQRDKRYLVDMWS